MSSPVMSWWFPSKTPKGSETANRPETDLAMLASGNPDSMAALYRRYGRTVYRFAYALSASREAAEETTQEVFLFLLREWRRFDPQRGTLEAWMLGVTRQLARKHARSTRVQPLDDEETETPATGPRDGVLEHLLQQEVTDHLHRAIAELPEAYREALVLHALQGHSYEQAATALGCPVGTVRSRIARAKELLTQRLAPGNGTGVSRSRGTPETTAAVLPAAARRGGNDVR